MHIDKDDFKCYYINNKFLIEVYFMIILGIDPGFAIVGVGVIEYKGNKFRVLDYFAITTKRKIPSVILYCLSSSFGNSGSALKSTKT